MLANGSLTAEVSISPDGSGRALLVRPSTMAAACWWMIVSTSADMFWVSRMEVRAMMALERCTGSGRASDRKMRGRICGKTSQTSAIGMPSCSLWGDLKGTETVGRGGGGMRMRSGTPSDSCLQTRPVSVRRTETPTWTYPPPPYLPR